MFMAVLPPCVSVCHMCAVTMEARRGYGILGTGVVDIVRCLCLGTEPWSSASALNY